MRVVGGQFRGRALLSPDDRRVRPTSDRVREALFNILAHNDFGVDFELRGARVLDLFAGTGALGIEALSRGAAYCLFVDDSAESRGLIRGNVETFNLTGITKIWRRDATELGPMPGNAGEAFGLVFLDPPYRKGLCEKALASALSGGWLTEKAVAVVEQAADEPQLGVDGVDGFDVVDTRGYGETRVTILARAAAISVSG